jgi:opacity protein-like surface antigen
MKRTGLTVAALVLGATVFAAGADAQARVGIAAGLAAPTGDFGDFANSGYHIEGSVEFRPATMPFGIRADIFYNNFGFSDELQSDLDSDGSFRGIGGALSAVFQMSGVSASPYLVVGPSVTNLDTDIDDSSIETDSETKFGLQAGGGVKFPLSGFTSKLEARYNHVFSDDEDTGFPDVSYFTVTFGLLFGGAR